MLRAAMPPALAHARPGRALLRLTAAAAAALTACSLLAAPAGASLRGGAPAKRITDSRFTDVSCPAANDCWAVGSVNNDARAEIYHWDGSAWTQVPLEHPRTGFTSLNSVSCPSVALCWAVGAWTFGTERKSYMLRWNGTQWSAKGPDIGGTPGAVFCASTADCWVAGGVKVEHWNGSRWAPVPARPVFHDGFRPALYCVRSDDCWMTATKLNEHGVVIAHWNGHTWLDVRNPVRETEDVSMPGLSCLGATACLAAGGVAVSWNGSKWSRADAGLAANAIFSAVSCTAGLPCLAVGSNSAGLAFSERWDGAQWHPVTTPAPSGTNSELNGISCVTASDCWAVGNQFSATTTLNLIEHWDGTAWSVFS
jgi:hypothetical protein